ncbi:hypothetical protein ABZ917_37560 [Nonomuraea wenchangensis]
MMARRVPEPDPERLARFSAEHPRAKAAGSLEEALAVDSRRFAQLRSGP